MRGILCVGIAISLALATLLTARADDAADARALIAKSIKATGGKEKLAKVKARTWTEKDMDKSAPITTRYAVQWPDKFRMEMAVPSFTFVADGDKGWIKGVDETKDLTEAQFASHKASQAVLYVSTLVPLDDQGYTLTTLPEVKVDGKPAMGVKVTKKGMPDVSLYFDKATNLLVKYSFRARNKGKELTEDVYLSDYRDVDGVKVPKRMTTKKDDKLFQEVEITDVKLLEKLDNKLFAKP